MRTYAYPPGGGGGVLQQFLAGVCRWDSENLSLYQSMLTFILQPYSRVNTENPYPILDLFPDFLMLTGLRKVVVLPAVPISKCHLPGNFLKLNFSSNSLVLWKMIPYSRPKLSDF